MIFPDRAGGGDIKFVASVGFVLGLLPTLWGGILGLSLAIVYAAARACIEKHCAATPTPIGQIAIPLAPFLSIGFAIFYVLEVMNMKKFRIEKKTAIKCIGILAPLAAAAIIVPKAIRHKNALRV